MLVNGSGTDIAASGQRHQRLFVLAQQRSQKVIGCPNPPDRFILHAYGMDGPSDDPHAVLIDPLYDAADSLNGIQHHVDIPDIGEIPDHHRFIRHNRGGQNTQCRILRSADGHIAHQRIAAFHNILNHIFLFLRA